MSGKPSGWHRKRPTANSLAHQREMNSAPYRKRRALIRAEINAGCALCWRCGTLIPPGTGHAGHTGPIGDPTTLILPEHTSCNLKDGARRGAEARNAKSPFTRRDW